MGAAEWYYTDKAKRVAEEREGGARASWTVEVKGTGERGREAEMEFVHNSLRGERKNFGVQVRGKRA